MTYAISTTVDIAGMYMANQAPKTPNVNNSINFNPDGST
jgi:hypothetical protein